MKLRRRAGLIRFGRPSHRPLIASHGGARPIRLGEASRRCHDDAAAPKGHAFKLSTAILFAVLVTVVGVASTLAREWLGAGGALATSAVAGLADAHSSSAAAAAMSAAGRLDRTIAAAAVLVAVTANSATKVVLAFTSGPRRYAFAISAGLVLVLAGMWLAASIAVL